MKYRFGINSNGDIILAIKTPALSVSYESVSAYFAGADLVPGYSFFKLSISLSFSMGY